MSLAVQKAGLFEADVARHFGWYLEQANEEAAWRFLSSVDGTLFSLSRQPELGRRRHFRNPLLSDLRSFRVEPPFNKLLIFYRTSDDVLYAWRLMHGTRDRQRRLLEPPNAP